MVITLEPGVYLPGIGRDRLEDVVLVTNDSSGSSHGTTWSTAPGMVG